jgi:hypothetical protein
MKLLRILPVPFLLFSTAYGGLVQSVNPQVPLEYALVKAEVVEMFEHGYQQYKWDSSYPSKICMLTPAQKLCLGLRQLSTLDKEYVPPVHVV